MEALYQDNTNYLYKELDNLERENSKPVQLPQEIELDIEGSNCRLMRITNLTYEKDFPRLEAFENVVTSINNKQNCRLVYYLHGTEQGVEFYIGVVDKSKTSDSSVIRNYRDSLARSFKGNFVGTRFSTSEKDFKEEKEQGRKIQEELRSSKLKYSIVLGVPSKNTDKEAISFQGIDRLVNIMSGISFHMIAIWEPISKKELKSFDAAVKKIYSDLVYYGKFQIQESTQHSEQKGTNSSEGTSDTRGTNEGWSKNHQTSKGESDNGSSSSKNWGSSTSKGTSGGSSETHATTNSTGKSESTTDGRSEATTREVQNKMLQELIKYVDEELLLRLKQGQAKGMYKTAIYLGTEFESNLTLLENSVTSIFQGDKSTFFPLEARKLPDNEFVRTAISNFSFIENMEAGSSLLPLCSRPIVNNSVGLSTYLTASEISIIAGMPQKEVPGLQLREQVGFGLNSSAVSGDDEIYLGKVYQEGTELENRISLQKSDLNKHIFIAGTTGSGKTTTCHRLLDSSKMPFLVIEPAKTEYRVLLNDPSLNEKGLDNETIQKRISEAKPFGEILLFTVGNEEGVPFRFNPFEFLPTENLSGHVDLLKACFMASFDMEAAIPNLLEEALYKVYERFGWDFSDNSNFLLENREDAWKMENGGKYFPTISDYIDIFVDVVNSKGFDERLKNDYLGSIRGRLDSLRTGTKKLMFDTRLSVNFEELLDRRVIIELEELKSGEDKSFIMGLILGRLTEALKARHKKQPSYKHITLVEEAHRLLSRPMPGDSSNKKLGVEMFADLLAEVRKYGESLIIVDQIPNKLAPEVLKNTNTKIIHKIFARDDKEAVGDTMALDEKQRNYLSHLLPGEAIVFTQGWLKPIDTQVEQLATAKTTEQKVSDEEAYSAGWKYWEANPVRFCPVLAKNPSMQAAVREDLLKVKKCVREAENAIYQLFKNNYEFWLVILEKSRKDLGELADFIFREVFVSYLFNKKIIKEVSLLNAKNFEAEKMEEIEKIVTNFLNCKSIEEVNELRNQKQIKNKYF